jgi:hypothetical protein
MVNEVLCKFVCHNLCCLIQEQCELGIEAIFWGEENTAANGAVVLDHTPRNALMELATH